MFVGHHLLKCIIENRGNSNDYNVGCKDIDSLEKRLTIISNGERRRNGFILWK